LGGKWTRAKKAHVFPSAPTESISRVVVDGESSDVAQDFEFIETRPEDCSKLLDGVDLKPGDLVLESSCGDGALLVAILAAKPQVELHAYEVRDSAVRRAYKQFPWEKPTC
jgi:cyclopropane fatty-acyl-phospholipid synthase-like methyltransferase